LFTFLWVVIGFFVLSNCIDWTWI